MPYVCSECGQPHEGMPRYVQRGAPHLRLWERRRLRWDDRFMCRVPGHRYFISCEIAIPFHAFPDQAPLGYIGWVEVHRYDYDRYRWYRRRERLVPRYSTLVRGRWANRIPIIPQSLGTPVKFAVLRGDPTPYIKWAAPTSAIAARIKAGATSEFWHGLAGLVGTRQD